MMQLASRRVLGRLILSTLFWGTCVLGAVAQAPTPLELGNRRELFIDDHLIAEMKQTQLLVHQPVREEIVAECDASVAALIGKPVLLKVWMQEADLYSLVFK